MNFESIKHKIKSKLGIADAEFFVVLILTSGLLIGSIYNIFFSDNLHYDITSKDALFNTLDSLAEVSKTTFIGSDTNNNSISELEILDTIVKKEYWQKPKKNEFKGLININTASETQLQQLYRIGEKTAKKIIEYREQHTFKRKEDIMKVKGIGSGTYEKIKNNIKV